MKRRIFLYLSLLVLPIATRTQLSAQTKSTQNSRDLQSTERKLNHLESNAAQSQPDATPIEFTEREINAYVASGNVTLPAGVQSVTFEVQPGVVIGHAKVDFDQLKAGKNSYNPLLSVFSGIHDVVVTTQAHGAHGQGFVHVDSVSLDGVEVPQFALEMFVDKYLKPKYPYLGIDSRFALPERVDSATAGLHKVTLTQK